MAADDSGSEAVETSPVVAANAIDPVSDLEQPRVKAIDVGVLQYLKLVHTELYEKLKAAVRSIKNNQ